MKKNKGFTLVELLAVVVILAILIVISTPAVTGVLKRSREQSFKTYAMKIENLASQKYNEESLDDDSYIYSDSCFIWNIETDLGLGSTGDYKGFIAFNYYDVTGSLSGPSISMADANNNEEFFISLLDNEPVSDADYGYYQILLYDKNNAYYKRYDTNGVVLEDNLTSYKEFRSYLKATYDTDQMNPNIINYFFNLTGCYCEDAFFDSDPTPANEKFSYIQDYDSYNINAMLNGMIGCSDIDDSSCKLYDLKPYTGSSPNKRTKNVFYSKTTYGYPIYFWTQGDTLYYYSDARNIYVINGGTMFSYLPLKTADLSGFNFNKSLYLHALFGYCEKLEYVYFGKNEDEPVNMNRIKACDYMFSGCTHLKKIYVYDDWNFLNINNSTNMFRKCYSLSGKVPFNESYVDHNRANLNGYLTLRT